MGPTPRFNFVTYSIKTNNRPNSRRLLPLASQSSWSSGYKWALCDRAPSASWEASPIRSVCRRRSLAGSYLWTIITTSSIIIHPLYVFTIAAQANTKLILYETKIITPTLNTWYDVSPIHLRFYEAQRTRLLSHGSLLESRQGLVQNCSTKDVSEIRILDSGILQILVVVKLEIIMMMTLKGEI